MRQGRVRSAFGFVVLLFGLPAMTTERAQATLFTYTDRASFEAASIINTTIDFEGYAPVDSFTFYPSPPGLTISGATFTSVNDRLFVIDPNYLFPEFFWTSGQYLIDNTFEADPALRGLVVALPGGVTAFGTDVSSFGPGTILVELSTGDVIDVQSPGRPDFTFIGFTSTQEIVSVTFNKTEDSVVLDNIAFGQIVPEPASLALAGIGLAGLALGALRRRSL